MPDLNNRLKTQKTLPKERERGAQKGNRNAAKIGDDLRVEFYLSKLRRGFLEEWFELKFGRKAFDDDELRQAVRQIANTALDHALIEEFEQHQPGRTSRGQIELF